MKGTIIQIVYMLLLCNYMRELASLWIAYGGWKFQEILKQKNSKEKGEKPDKRVWFRKTIFSVIRKEG